jgi:uncharacterized membrane protein
LQTEVFFAVLMSAVFQAGWNFFTKKSKADKIAVLAVGWFFLGLVLAAASPWFVDYSVYNSDWLKFSFASGFIHAFYLVFLGWAYTAGDISMVYPVARGLGILWTVLFSALFSLHAFSVNGGVGVLSIISGVLLISHSATQTVQQKKAFFVAVVLSLIISLYSLVDSAAAKKVPFLFLLMMMDLIAPAFVIPFLYKKSPTKIMEVLRFHKAESFFIAVAGSISYIIILWAFSKTSVSYIAALREISVIIASILGISVLNESLSKAKIIGIICVFIGVIFIKCS